MTTLTQLAKDLQIGKGTLYKVLSNLGITPYKQGRSRVLDDEQIKKIQKSNSLSVRPETVRDRQASDFKRAD